jgi:hypothetical protein
VLVRPRSPKQCVRRFVRHHLRARLYSRRGPSSVPSVGWRGWIARRTKQTPVAACRWALAVIDTPKFLLLLLAGGEHFFQVLYLPLQPLAVLG